MRTSLCIPEVVEDEEHDGTTELDISSGEEEGDHHHDGQDGPTKEREGEREGEQEEEQEGELEEEQEDSMRGYWMEEVQGESFLVFLCFCCCLPYL